VKNNIKLGLIISTLLAFSSLSSYAMENEDEHHSSSPRRLEPSEIEISDSSDVRSQPIQGVRALNSTGKVELVKLDQVILTKSSFDKWEERDFAIPIVSGFMQNEHEINELHSYNLKPISDQILLPEAVIGADDRIQVVNTTPWPWRVQGKLTMTFPNNRTYIGSGTLINRHHVLTAGHCVFDKDLGGWATSITFVPAQNDTTRPFGVAVSSRLVSVKGWTEEQNSDWDMGMIILDRDIGDNTGWFGIITGPDNILTNHYVNITGYPGDIPQDQRRGRLMYTMQDAIKRVDSEVLGYYIDTFGGQSGSGVWSHWEGQEGYHCAGIHVRGSSTENQATRLSKVKFDRVVEWMNTW